MDTLEEENPKVDFIYTTRFTIKKYTSTTKR